MPKHPPFCAVLALFVFFVGIHIYFTKTNDPWIRIHSSVLFGELSAQALSIRRKKLPSWKNFGLFGPFFWQKLGTWVLLSSVRVTKKNPSSRSKNIRPKAVISLSVCTCITPATRVPQPRVILIFFHTPQSESPNPIWQNRLRRLPHHSSSGEWN